MRSTPTVATLALIAACTAAATITLGQSVSVSISSTANVSKSPVSSVDPPPRAAGRPVDLVICLDTSGSMTALIDSARAKLWEVVNELAAIEPTPVLRVGLLTYGSPGVASLAEGWIVRKTDLTSDLDTLYGKMMEMSTQGGDEFVGWVLNDAVQTMSWSPDPNALKIIFVAGNESADQAASRFNFRSVAQCARNRGIVINAIYAGGRSAGISEHWEQVAQHGGGHYTAISMEAGTVQIATPQDKILIELNAELNATYVPFGSAGREGKDNQIAQDDNAARLGWQSASSRAAAKGTKLYSNARWDLVDALEQEDFDLSKVKKEDLPVVMQTMAPKDQRRYVGRRRSSRAKVARKIRTANEARQRYLRTQQPAGVKSLDAAMMEAVREQAKSKGMKVKAKP